MTMTSASLSGLGMAQAYLTHAYKVVKYLDLISGFIYVVLYARAKPSTTEPSSFKSSDVDGDVVPPMR